LISFREMGVLKDEEINKLSFKVYDFSRRKNRKMKSFGIHYRTTQFGKDMVWTEGVTENSELN